MNRTKLFLLQYQRQVERIRQLENRIAAVNASIESAPRNYDGMPHGTGLNLKTEQLAVKLADMKERAEREVAAAWEIREDIERVIGSVEDPALSRLLYDRYILRRSWLEISEALAYDETYTRGRLHSRALEAAEKFLPKQ